MADESEATVIFLRSHPVWIAAQRQARERSKAMHRHPSSLTQRRTAASGGEVIRDFKVYSSTDTPA
ncbi:hypothetical protein H7H82_04865 [Mycobacterium heidelbergense]|uniref:Uncharacterized protein n=1 Tax=Mycobacterium heidelbergense TaxID=53376 RepID=A0A1X0DUR5_MYCHE|nr:hypothetical protein [Mycobacterium heidelbergense]MCV7049939.1 hypothetical protein [Mycobacterium heidelbergense]ORA76048.1 hypothetical protein BST25_03485 [Mycobacterium heidelbergense]BBZ52418.1 hypothetical protein MHEI_41350 [Mycobacterium heidelbergense]